MANIVASYLRDTFAIDARIKWPNDILVGGKKIAGILIEARVQDDRVFLLIGTGINVEPVKDDTRPNAIAISEVAPRDFTGIETATLAFVEHVDEQLSHPLEHDAVLAQWRALAVHQPGDRIHCVLGDTHRQRHVGAASTSRDGRARCCDHASDADVGSP